MKISPPVIRRKMEKSQISDTMAPVTLELLPSSVEIYVTSSDFSFLKISSNKIKLYFSLYMGIIKFQKHQKTKIECEYICLVFV